MKVIELKVLGQNPEVLAEKVKKQEMTNEAANKLLNKDIYINYKDMILNHFETPQQGQQPMNPGQLRLAIKIMDKVEAAGDGGKLYLEDAEYNFFKPRVEAMNFVLANKNILQFVDDVVNAPEAEMPKAA